MENIMKVTRKGFSNISLLTPPDKLHYQQRRNNSKGPKEKAQAKRNKIVKFFILCKAKQMFKQNKKIKKYSVNA
jgi:hypothetical protein